MYNNDYINWYYPNRFFLGNVRGMYTIAELQNIIRVYPESVLIDVRSPAEYTEEHIIGAINIPEYEINRSIYRQIPTLDAQVFVYCASRWKKCKCISKAYSIRLH